MSSKNILIFLNTDFHVETALSIYQSLILKKYSPTILLDYEIIKGDFEVENFFKENGFNYLTRDMFDKSINKDSFHKMIVVTGHQNIIDDNLDNLSKPINYNFRMEMFKDRAILIYHRADYSEYFKRAHNYFINPKGVSVTQFSQKFGLDYIHQIENPLSEKKQIKIKNNKIVKLLLIGRFSLANRDISILKIFEKIDQKIDKKIKVILIGEKPKDETKFDFIKKYKLNNIEFDFKFDINQLDFYEEISSSDIFLNLIHGGWYFGERFTSNINHIIAFSKFNISPFLLNLTYNIPGLSYKKNFEEVILQALNVGEEERKKIINDFEKVKENLRNHNNFIFDKLLQ
jgi:hypothetical protein